MPLAAATNKLKPVRIAIIGFDGHTGEAVEIARENPSVQIVAYEARTERENQRARSAKDVLAGAKHYDDYRKLLAEERLDAVCICDQNWRRSESVIACLEKGVPTAAEKPMGISMAELDEVKRVAKKTGTPLTMLLPMRFYPQFVVMRDIVQRGEIGEPVNLSAQKSYQLGERPDWMKDRETFGGTIPYIACHTIDLLRFISGRDMVATAAFQGRVGFPELGEMENTAAISYQLDNGGTADVRLDYLRPAAADTHGDDRIRVAGTKGVIEQMHGKVTLVTADKPLHEVTERPQPPRLFEDFLEAVQNKREPLLTQADIFRVTEIVIRSREAADAGQVLKI
ncbi:MAG: Gfo/Idh/MocA family oxidoreductase [Acidobacteria bacterium]|nr:Gfo/Idh/MocA family oxidoreductase [Acidobacteriota bacterium]